MKFTKSLCPHTNFEKSPSCFYYCKKCSATKIIPFPKILNKKNNDIFCKPSEYCFNYEINIIQLIKNQINDDEMNFVNYKEALDNYNKTKNNSETNDSGSCNTEKKLEVSSEDSSYINDNNSIENENLQMLDLFYKNRKDILYHIEYLCKKYNKSKKCFYFSMTLIEKYFKIIVAKDVSNYEMDLIINAFFILAYKYAESDNKYFIRYKSFKPFFNKVKNLNGEDLKRAEILCLQILEYDLNITTIFDLLNMVLSAGIVLEKEINDFNVLSKIYNDCFYLLNCCFRENDIILEHSLSEIVFSIVYLVRKKNNIIYNTEKLFQKLYNIELKKYLNCINHISSIFYKGETINNKILVLKDDIKDNTNNNAKKLKFDVDNNFKETLKDIPLKKENEKTSNSSLHENNIKSIAFSSSKDKTLKSTKNIIIKGQLSNKIMSQNIKEPNIDNKNKNNSLIFDCPINRKNSEKFKLKPLKLGMLNSTKNLFNSKFEIDSHNNNIRIINSNNEIIKIVYKSPSNKITKLNKNLSKYVDYLRGTIKNNNFKNKKLNNIKSSSYILESNSKNNNNISNNKNTINIFKMKREIKNDLDEQFLDDIKSARIKKIHYSSINATKNKSIIQDDLNGNNNRRKLRFGSNLNKEGKSNIFKIVNKIYKNLDKGNIKLPLINNK